MNKISEKILADANRNAAEIEDKALLEERKYREQKERELAHIESEYHDRLREIYRSELYQEKAKAEIEIRKAILRGKREMMKEVLDYVAEYVKKSSEVYCGFLEAMVLRGILSGNEEIIVSEEDRKIFNSQFLKRLNEKAAEQLGRPTYIRLSTETRETGGGLFLKEDKIEFNATIEAVIKRVSEDCEMALSNLLFSETD